MMDVKSSHIDFVGSIGDDDRGREIDRKLKEEGVTGYFHKDQTGKSSAVCAVVISGKERTLTTDLAAACAYQESHFDANQSLLDNCKFIYVTAYFITSCAPVLYRAAAYANERNIPFGFNLSAVFLQLFENCLLYTSPSPRDRG